MTLKTALEQEALEKAIQAAETEFHAILAQSEVAQSQEFIDNANLPVEDRGLSTPSILGIEREDAHPAVISILDQKDTVVSWSTLLDGHAGGRMPAHCSHHLLDCIRVSEEFTCSL